MNKLLILLIFFLFQSISVKSQVTSTISWWNPVHNEVRVIEGQAWPNEVENDYDRLPAKAKTKVREAVWNLSKHASGLMIRFRSNSESITVRYQVNGNLDMPHMPATGVSGVDLYAIDSDGQWMWCRGRRNFSDTITYRFHELKANDGYHNMGREYRLYLPLYNSIKWLEIGVPDETYFKPLPVRDDKPIVVYGTSIAHGACASRPGMAWTNILSRKMDRPLINLAFSGNGRLEKELIDLIQEIEAKIYILDCLPNLWRKNQYSDDDLTNRILNSARQLKTVKPHIPILITEHAGYTDGLIEARRMEAYSRVNKIQKRAFQQLKNEGLNGIYYLTKEELGLQLDDMVDGTHPNDLGMAHYATSYEKTLRHILNEQSGSSSTMEPRIQYREPGNYDWEERHREILEMNRTSPPRTVILANSIIHFWGGLPRAKIVREEESWSNSFTPMGVRNLAYGWDRIENVLWRIYHGELDGYQTEKVIIMIGTNNLYLNTDDEIIDGLSLLINSINIRQPNAKLMLMGLLPRRNQEDRIENLNFQISNLAGNLNIDYQDIGQIFLNEQGKIKESLFSDGLHPNEEGYIQMSKKLTPILQHQ